MSEIKEKICTHAHCRCMNKDCSNFHYATCNAEYIAQKRYKEELKRPIQFEVSREELQLLTGILMLYRLHGFSSVHESKRELGIKLAERLSLLEIKQWGKY